MKTFSFYSYKGGVGRSLLVANAARFLALLGKRVVAVDLDLEAPGLHYKLGLGRLSGKVGVSSYLSSLARGEAQDSLVAIEVAVPRSCTGTIHLLPAGAAPSRDYWEELAGLGELLDFSDPNGSGVASLLEMKARIEAELKPDVLLIDARTGVTEIGGFATTLLADTVVCLSLANSECLDGTQVVIEGLLAAPRLEGQRPIEVVPVLSRVSQDGSLSAEIAEAFRAVAKRIAFERKAPKPKVAKRQEWRLRADPNLASERLLLGAASHERSNLFLDYLDLFRELFGGQADAELVASATVRMRAVAELRHWLTERSESRSRFGPGPKPWADDELKEVVPFGSGQDRRVADLVCEQAGKPVLVAELVQDEKEIERTVEWWRRNCEARALLLLLPQFVSQPYSEKSWRLFTRAEKWSPLVPSAKWPRLRPADFELLRDPGDTSLDALLDSLRRGYQEFLPRILEEYFRSTFRFPEGGAPWRPADAKRILDGLASVKEMDVARAIQWSIEDHLWRDPEERMESAPELWLELRAQLFWRLPVAIAIEQSKGRHKHRLGDAGGFEGASLLASELMGLRFEPMTDFRRELKRRIFDTSEEDDEPSRSIAQVSEAWKRARLTYHLEPRVPVSIDRRSPRREQGAPAGLKARLAAKLLQTNGELGKYDPAEARLELYGQTIAAVADALQIESRYLESVAFIHLSVLAYAHLARDLDGRIGYGFEIPSAGLLRDEVPSHVVIAQFFTHRLIEYLDDAKLRFAFERLCEFQGPLYSRWKEQRHWSLEKMRSLLQSARLGELHRELGC